MMLAYNVYLIGFMGTGKSAVASCLGSEYSLDVVEMDELLVKKEGESIANIFAQKGEKYFRERESSLLEEISTERNKVISCGGGVVLRKENVQRMRESGKIVLLTASAEVILERVKQDEGRPLLKGKKHPKEIHNLMEERRERYEEAADIIICTNGKSVKEISEELMEELKRVKERE